MKLSNLLALSLLFSPVLGGCGGELLPGEAHEVGTEESSLGGEGLQAACNATTCANGCCIAGSCYRVQSNYACGSTGGACAMCEVTQSCQKGDVLRGWECLPDQITQWVLRPVSARIPPKKPNGGNWDGDNSPPEALVVLNCPVNGAVTPVRSEESISYTPTFTQGACTTTAPELLQAPVTLRFLDIDVFVDDEIITTTHTFTEEDFQQGTIRIPITADGAYHLTLELARRE